MNHYPDDLPAGTPLDLVLVRRTPTDSGEEHLFSGGVGVDTTYGALVLRSGHGYTLAFAPGTWTGAEVRPGGSTP